MSSSALDSFGEKPNQVVRNSFLGFAAGYGGIAILRNLQMLFTTVFYCPPGDKGITYLSPGDVAMALVLAKCIDVLSDPIIGHISDHTQHRWGKRLPYIIVGVPIWLLATALIFRPPTPGESTLNFIYLTAVTSMFFIGMTLVQIPYSAVLPEISSSREETIKISSNMGRFFLFGVLIVIAGGFPLAIAYGFFSAAVFFCVIAAILLCGTIFSLFALKQTPRPISKAEPVLRSVWSIISQRPFVSYLAGHSLFIVGYVVMLKACPYFAVGIMKMPKSGSALLLLTAIISAILCSPIVERLSLRFGKKTIMLGAMGLYFFIFSFWFLVGKMPFIEGTATVHDVLGIESLNGRTVLFGVFVEGILLFAFAGAAASVQMLIPNAIVSDLILYDEKLTGRRRESLIFGLQSGIEKNAVIIASIIIGICLEQGKSRAQPFGIYLVGPLAAITCILGFLIFLKYPLDKNWSPSKTT